ncbi:hypothetical protein JCM21714_4119 [Gracilibacillus boraciitolerans JCM 21714]|uniref:Lipoprotein n=1 Tax=Gracilibacillus boraciitolerans JCM 21714 TaxID=1298598 RepID=W4VQB4_9BACI|nr:DUF1672 family protein [Gracilibacillus boraciitolerans]GAE94919.1 hypothetical protein JCM21714_4119 [Gracilibacillus boraciitolerans JCM 21714]
MLHKNNIIAIVILSALLLGGCNWMSEVSPSNQNDNEEIDKKETDDLYVPVQEYTGEEYTLPNGKETDRIANENRREIEKAIKSFFKEDYKTEVKVHNIVGNVDGGATVFVESVGKPHFYTYAIIPISKNTEEIRMNDIFTESGQVERAIMAGVYGMVNENEFQNLTDLIDDVKKAYNVTGINKKAVPIGANRYSNEYYFVSIRKKDNFEIILENYLDNPRRDKENWSQLINMENIKPDEIKISIKLYMEEEGVEPSEEAFNYLVKKIEQADNLPKGLYSVRLHDNNINIKSASGSKENSLKRANPNDIVKE